MNGRTRKLLAMVTLAALSGCRGKPRPGPMGEIWSLGREDGPLLVLQGDGTLTVGDAPVGHVDVDRRTLSVRGAVQDVSLDAIGRTSTDGDVQWFHMLESRWGIDGSGTIRASRLPTGAADGSPAVGPWGSLRPADAREVVRTGLMWGAILADLPQPAVASVRVWADDPCRIDLRVEASALADGRIVEGAVCSTDWSCDLGPEVGRWQSDGVVISERLGGRQPLDSVISPDGYGGFQVRPLGESEPWFVVSPSGEWSVAAAGPLSPGVHGLSGSVMRADGDADDGQLAVDAEAVAAWVGTILARRFREALTECTLQPPPPPPPPILPPE